MPLPLNLLMDSICTSFYKSVAYSLPPRAAVKLTALHKKALVFVKANWSGLFKFLHDCLYFLSWKRTEDWCNHLRLRGDSLRRGRRGFWEITAGLTNRWSLTAERIFAIVDGIAQLLQHHVKGRVLGQLDHKHAGLHTNVTQIRWAYDRLKSKQLKNFMHGEILWY